MKKQQVILPLLALLVSGAALSYDAFVRDSSGNIVTTPDECLHTVDYTAADEAECPLNKKPMAVMTKPKPAPVVIKKPTPKPAPVFVSTPATKPTPVLKEVINLEGVNFETGSNRLTGGSLNTLDSVAQELKANPGTNIVVEGHTDDLGNALMNKNLSQSRAEAVREHLVAQGVSADSISAKGVGEARPIASNDTSSGRAQNRRVELRIFKINWF